MNTPITSVGCHCHVDKSYATMSNVKSCKLSNTEWGYVWLTQKFLILHNMPRFYNTNAVEKLLKSKLQITEFAPEWSHSAAVMTLRSILGFELFRPNSDQRLRFSVHSESMQCLVALLQRLEPIMDELKHRAGEKLEAFHVSNFLKSYVILVLFARNPYDR